LVFVIFVIFVILVVLVFKMTAPAARAELDGAARRLPLLTPRNPA